MSSNELPESPEIKADQTADQERTSPRFGRLLIVLIFAVFLVVLITFGSEAYFTP